MPTFEAIATNDTALPFSTQKQSGEEKVADAGFLAMLAQMFFGTAEQRATPTANPTDRMSVGNTHPMLPTSPLEGMQTANTNPVEVFEGKTFSDGVSSFEIVSREPLSQDIRPEHSSREKLSSTPHQVERVPSQRDASQLDVTDRTTSPFSVAEGGWDYEDVASSFEIIAKFSAQLPRNAGSASRTANGTISPQHMTLSQTQSREPVRTQLVSGANRLDRASVNGIPSVIADDIVRWDEARVQAKQKPEQLEAYMKVASELRAVADKFSVGISKATITGELIPSSVAQLKFEQSNVQLDSANELDDDSTRRASVEKPSTADVARMSKQGDAGDRQQLSEGETTAFVPTNRSAEEQGATSDVTVFVETDKQFVAAARVQSEPVMDEQTESTSIVGGVHDDHELVAATKIQREDVQVQPTRLNNDSAREYLNHQPMPGNAEAVAPKQTLREIPVMPTVPVLPDDFGNNLMLEVTDGFRLHLEGKSEGIHIVLKPETLGELTIRATMEDGRITAQIRVQLPEVKAALEAQIPQLREALVSQGIDVQRVEIVSDGGEMRFYNSNEGRASHQRPSRFRRGQKDVDAVEELDAVRSLGYNTIEYII